MGGEYIIALGFSILTILVLCFFYAIIFNLKTKQKNENSNTNSFENNIDDEEIEIVILDEDEEEVDDNISKKIKKARKENEKQ